MLMLWNSETLEYLWNAIDFQSRIDLDKYNTKVTDQSLSMTCDLIIARLNQEVDMVYNNIVSWHTCIC